MSCDLVASTPAGLFCEPGGFHVDPWLPVPLAVVTHAHGDHARPGSGQYVCAAPGAELLRRRVGDEARIRAVAYGERVEHGAVVFSFHPAGHVLGSAQVRIEGAGATWVVTSQREELEQMATVAIIDAESRSLQKTHEIPGQQIFFEPCKGYLEWLETGTARL